MHKPPITPKLGWGGPWASDFTAEWSKEANCAVLGLCTSQRALWVTSKRPSTLGLSGEMKPAPHFSMGSSAGLRVGSSAL